MILGIYYDALELHRQDKILYGRFLTPHRVVSTCQAAGGMQEDLELIYNHQVCEPAKHDICHGRRGTPLEERQKICQRHGLAQNAASLGTAANMRCAGIVEKRFRDLAVVAACTAGVEGNAGRVGDPAGIFEWDGGFEYLQSQNPKNGAPPVSSAPQESDTRTDSPQAPNPHHGTINTLLFISHELTPGALVRSLMTATEAKSAVLQDLAIGSRYSQGIATGTGTDQIASACRLNTGKPLTWAGKHSVLGQLIGEAVYEAIRDALVMQNGLSPDRRRSVLAQLKRFGMTEDRLLIMARSLLSEKLATLLESNLLPLVHDPLVAAAGSALAQSADQLRVGILPLGCVPELSATLGAQMACAVSGNYGEFERMREQMQSTAFDPAELAAKALVLGFASKWECE